MKIKQVKNIVFIVLLGLLLVEILILFPRRLKHDDDADVRARVEAQSQAQKEREDKISRGEKVEEAAPSSEQRMQGVHLVESQQGTRDWELFSASAQGSQGEGTWKLHKVKVLFYNKEKVEFTVTGDTGTIDQKTKNLSVIGNVVTHSVNGYTFKTPSIFYHTEGRVIQSPNEVYMNAPPDKNGPGMTLTGRQMKVFVDTSKMIIQDRVKASKIESGKKMEIVADGAEFSGKSRQADFKGSVRISYDNMRIEGPEANFLYSTATKFIESVNVLGGVRVSDANKFATSEKVNLNFVENKYTFQGRPKVIQNNDELSGDEIVFLDGGKKVKVQKVRAKVENRDQ